MTTIGGDDVCIGCWAFIHDIFCWFRFYFLTIFVPIFYSGSDLPVYGSLIHYCAHDLW